MHKQFDINEKPPLLQALPLAFQHVFAMFGATVLVPFLTGLDPAVALFTSGIGTLIFHLITKGKVPAYLGSSFAFIPPLAAYVSGANDLPSAMGGAFVAGLVYIVVFGLIKVFGTGFIKRLVPSVVVGPVVMIIGLALADVAVKDMASPHWPTAIFTLVMAIIFSVFTRGFFKVVPILLGIVSGYIFAAVFQMVEPSTQILLGKDLVPLFSLDPVLASFQVQNVMGFLHLPQFVVPTFKFAAIMAIAPIALVAIIEDLGHILVIGNITKRDLVQDPGFDNVLLGNGLATSVAALFGGPPSTTYGENIGVISITKVYSSMVIQIAAVIAILLSFFNPVRALISSIPVPVMGGIVILLFGMIAAAGIRSMIDAKTDLSSTRNLIIASIILILGVGLKNVGYATLAGIVLNLILPQEKTDADYIATLEADAGEETK